jgi:hypothetical protein
MAYGAWQEGGQEQRAVWLHLRQRNNGADSNDRFGFFAKIGNATAASDSQKTAEVLFLESGPSGGQWNRHRVFRLTANPGSNTFELALAATVANGTNSTSGTASNFGCGLRMKSNGTYIKVSGLQNSGSTACGSATAFANLCYQASDLAATASSNCDSITFSFTEMTNATLTTDVQTAIASALQFDSMSSLPSVP